MYRALISYDMDLYKLQLLNPIINGRMLIKIPFRHEYSHGPLATAISALRFDT